MIRLFVALAFISTALASVGDQLPVFRQCVSNCIDRVCENPEVPSAPLPLHMRVLQWDCAQNCDYTCQQLVTFGREVNGQPTVQFHGKWPFVRLAGIQEPASVFFSLLNLVPHVQGFRYLRTRAKNDDRAAKAADVGMRPFYLVFGIVGMNAWLWSSVFHTRDFLVTERLDYFSAGLMILYGLYTSVVRIWRLDKRQNATLLYIWSFVCATVYILHVSYLSLVHFSYTYNMAFGVITGVGQNLLWIYHAVTSYRTKHINWMLWPAYIVLSITAGMMFELFDFAPLWAVLDAHSLWHAATIIPTYMWYAWMRRDMSYLIKGKYS